MRLTFSCSIVDSSKFATSRPGGLPRSFLGTICIVYGMVGDKLPTATSKIWPIIGMVSYRRPGFMEL